MKFQLPILFAFVLLFSFCKKDVEIPDPEQTNVSNHPKRIKKIWRYFFNPPNYNSFKTTLFNYDGLKIKNELIYDTLKTPSSLIWSNSTFAVFYNSAGTQVKTESRSTFPSLAYSVDVNYIYDNSNKLQFEITTQVGFNYVDTIKYQHIGNKTIASPMYPDTNYIVTYYTNGDVDSILGMSKTIGVISRDKYIYHATNKNKENLWNKEEMPLKPENKELLKIMFYYKISGIEYYDNTTNYTYQYDREDCHTYMKQENEQPGTLVFEYWYYYE